MNSLERKNYNELTKNIQNFVDYVDIEEKSMKAYKAGIKLFFEYLEKNGVKTPTRNDVLNFRNMLIDNYSSNTVNLYMISLRQLFNYLEKNGIYNNITVDVKGAKYDTTPKKQVLTLDQVQNIYKNLTDKREKALFGLLITTGLRGIEVQRANIEDIKIHNGEVVLWIQCKKHSQKDEYVKLSKHVLEDIKEYVGERKFGSIFISTSNENYGKGISTTSIRKIIKSIFKRFGLDDDSFSLHSTRRTNAVISYETGSSIYDIQQVLHHTSINTTTRYLKQVNRDKNKTEYNVSSAMLGGF